MAELHAPGQFVNGRIDPGRKSLDRQQELVLLRLQAARPGGLLAISQEPADLMTKLGQGAVLGWREILLHAYIVSRYNSSDERLGRGQPVAAGDQFFGFLPIDRAHIQPQRDPAARSDISRQIKPFRLRADQLGVVAGQNLAGHRDNSIAVMVVQEVRKNTFSRTESRMVAAVPAFGFGQRQADFRETREVRMFRRHINMKLRPLDSSRTVKIGQSKDN